jgi:enamine deaminase RidA (YjgF/YER057c/UK114 family)
MVSIDKFCAPGVFDPQTYSQGMKVTQAQSVLFLSGQVAYTADGGVAYHGDFKGQARGAFEAIKALIESQGGAMTNIVKITTFVTDMRYRADLAPIREEFLGRKGPASTLVEISQLAHPDWMIEIEAIAVL